MLSNPYFCDLCGQTFISEQACYEHDISKEHHRIYENSQKHHHRKINHFCSVCNVGGMTSMVAWLNHLSGKPHNRRMKYFYDFYSNTNQRGTGQSRSEVSHHSQKSQSRISKNDNHVAPKDVGASDLQPLDIDSTQTCESLTPVNVQGKQSLDDYRRIAPVEREGIGTTGCSEPNEQQSTTNPRSQNGLMLSILETVSLDPSAPEVASTQNHQHKKPNGIRRVVSGAKRAHPDSNKRTVSNTRKQVNKSRTHVVKPMRFDPPAETLDLPQANVEVLSSSSTAALSGATELSRMHEALELSHKLVELNNTQAALESLLLQTQTKLKDVKSQKRTLKLRRAALLKGLTCSDSDEEPTSLVPASQSTTTEPLVSASPTTADRLLCEKQVASVAPVNAAVNRSAAGMPGTHPVVASIPSFPVSQEYSTGLPIPADATPSRTQSISSTSSESLVCCEPTQSPAISSTTVTSRPIAYSAPVTITTCAAPLITASSQKSASADGSTAMMDFDRLALIRQALQSPDSWQFTFDDVDRMLQRTASRAVASTSGTEAAAAAPSITAAPTVSHLAVPTHDVPPVPAPKPVPRPLIKTEPQSHPEPPVHAETRRKETSSQLRVSTLDRCGLASADEFSDGSGQPSDSPGPPKKSRRVMKADPSRFTNVASSDNESQQHEAPHGLKAATAVAVRYGEFHAFDGGPAAVTSMALHRTSSSVLIGGQNGLITQVSLKDHQLVRRFPAREASVTRMALDAEERYLFAGYYDNRFIHFSAQSGLVLLEECLTSHVGAMSVSPTLSAPFVYLGMSSGDILRYSIADRSSSLIYQCPVTRAIRSMSVVRSGLRLLLIIGDEEFRLTVRDASDGSLVRCIQSAAHKGPPEGISLLPAGNFCAYSERSLRVHSWKTGLGVLTFQVHKITCLCVMDSYIALGDSEGSIRVHKLQADGLPSARPTKVYYVTTQAAVTSLISCGTALVSGSLDGTVTVIRVTEPASNYTCLYGPFGHNCGIGFESRKDLISHVLNTHLIFGSQKSIMCRWGAGRCRTRFGDTQSIKAITDHLLTHIPD